MTIVVKFTYSPDAAPHEFVGNDLVLCNNNGVIEIQAGAVVVFAGSANNCFAYVEGGKP